MSSMTEMIVLICREEDWIASIAAIVSRMIWLEPVVSFFASRAMRSACSARWIWTRTDWVIASIALAVSVIEAAWRSVRPARSSAPVRISSEPDRTAMELPPIAVIVSLSVASASLKLTRRLSSSLGKRVSI